MWCSVELLPNRKIFIQLVSERLKHGAVGKVLIHKCYYETALQIQKECNV
jgi:hypothetical protein